MRLRTLAAFVAAGTALALAGTPVRASSHSDAPLIKQDPQANLTDVYAFIGANRAGVKVLNVVIGVRPFCEPGDGVIYDRFAHDALYSIHIANPTTGATVMRYDFRFSPVTSGYKNLDTILSYGLGTEVGPIQDVGDARQNYVQTYRVFRTVRGSEKALNAGMTLMVPPPNVGQRTTPYYNDSEGRAVSGATTYEALDRYTKESLFDLHSGETVFAGMRDDPFFADAPGIFDLLNPRILGPDGHGQTGNGVDGFKGYNVLMYGIQIPIAALNSVPGFPEVGVYASVSRQHVRLLDDDVNDNDGVSRKWVQVNRLGNPLFNEVLVALKDKDNYNFASPTTDATRFATYALNPEVAHLLNVVYGTSFVEHGRTDLAAIFIPDVVRVDTSTGPVRLAGQDGFNRLSFIGGDTTPNGSGQSVPSGWPNGRRFGDDVVDIALTAVASGPSYSSIFLLGDNINANDQVFNQVFPYAATPNSGTFNRKDPGD